MSPISVILRNVYTVDTKSLQRETLRLEYAATSPTLVLGIQSNRVAAGACHGQAVDSPAAGSGICTLYTH